MRHIAHAVVATVFALYSLALTASADEPVPVAKIVAFGRYKSTAGRADQVDGVSGGVVIEARDIVHIESTNKIPAKVGEVFGFQLEFANLPTTRDYTLRAEMNHPPIVQPDGETLRKSVRQQTIKVGPNWIPVWVRRASFWTDPDGFFLWVFAEGFEYELVPGSWTQTVFVDDEAIASMTFEVKSVEN